MRILIHDFGGYAFPVQLSQALARRGHTVCHVYCSSLQTTPPGMEGKQHPSPSSLTIHSLQLAKPLNKYALVQRWLQERSYGQLIRKKCNSFHPDIVLSGNAPLSAQNPLLSTCKQQKIPFVYWLQDLLGIAAHRLLRKKQLLLGETVGRYFMHMERRLLRQSDAIIAITDDFFPLLQTYGVDQTRITVIENWANLTELPTGKKDNMWSQTHSLADKTCLLYAGTLSMKHNPEVILQLALQMQGDDSVRLVVISQGMGADYLQKEKHVRNLDNLILLPYQPKHVFPDILATADILMAVLEPDAGIFSVPSKVLTYLCAARPLLLAIPKDNLAARIVRRIQAGSIVPPDDPQAFIHAAMTLIAEPSTREAMGRRARRYAHETFDIESITDRFSAVFEQLLP